MWDRREGNGVGRRRDFLHDLSRWVACVEAFCADNDFVCAHTVEHSLKLIYNTYQEETNMYNKNPPPPRLS